MAGTIGGVGRRRTADLFVAALLSAVLAGCTAAAPPDVPRPAGSAAPAASAGTAAPPLPGRAPARSFAVGVRELKLNRDGDRPLPVTLWYPATNQAGELPERGADPAAGRFPVVVFSHGLGGRPADYQALLVRWARAGLVVAAPTFPHTSRGVRDQNVLDVLNQPADVSYVLTRVLALDQRAGDPLRGRLATDRVAAAGHSAGGVTTIGLFTAERDARLDAGIVLAGSALGVGTAFAGAAAPQLFVHGQRDEVVSYASGRAAYDAVPWPKAMLSLPKGEHGRALVGQDTASFTVVSETTVDFLRWTLYGDAAAKRRLPADAAKGSVARLENRL